MRSTHGQHVVTRWSRTLAAIVILTTSLLLAAPVLVGAPLPGAAPSPQELEGTKLQLKVDQDARGVREMGLWIGPLRLRMDQGSSDISLIWVGGESGGMSMIMHPQKIYMGYSMEDLEKMAGQTRARPPEQAESSPEDWENPPLFVATGNTKTVGGWSADEYRLEGPEDTPDAIFWFTADTGADLHPVLEQLVAAIDALNTPALQSISGGMPDGGLVGAMNERWDEMNVPPGFPVEIITNEGGTTTTITVISVEQGALDAADFEPPAGYQKMQIPIRR